MTTAAATSSSQAAATAATASLSTSTTATTISQTQTGTAPVPKRAVLGFLTPEIASYFVAGGCAGAASRTVVSPLERLKIIQQVQPRGSDSQYKGVWRSLVRMYNEEGFKGFMRGNGINCLRIVPYSAVQFTTYEQLKKVRLKLSKDPEWFGYEYIVMGGPSSLPMRDYFSPCEYAEYSTSAATQLCERGHMGTMQMPLTTVTIPEHGVMFFTRHGSKELDTPKRLASGALAGITSVCSTYPLDLVRSRLSIATASISLTAPPPAPKVASAPATTLVSPQLSSAYHTSSALASNATSAGAAASSIYTKADLTIWGMTLKIVREEGGIRALYRGLVTTAVGVAPYVGINFAAYEFLRGVITPPGKSSVPRKLLCGALAGSISQTLTYPFDVLRRKMQVTGMQNGSIKYNGAVDALRSIIRVEGVSGLYRGLWPNLLKVAPSIATSFFTYELVKEFLIPQ